MTNASHSKNNFPSSAIAELHKLVYSGLKSVNSLLPTNWIGSVYWLSKKSIRASCKEALFSMRGSVLDFGCGTMPYRDLLVNTSDYTPLEYDPLLPEGKLLEKGATMYYGGRKLPFPDNSFDAIISFQVLEHVRDITSVMAELRRVAKPSAYIVLSVPFIWPEHERPDDYRRFTEWGMRSLLEENGVVCTSILRLGNIYDIIGLLFLDRLNTSSHLCARILAYIVAPLTNAVACLLTLLDRSSTSNNRTCYLDLFVTGTFH